MFPNKQIALWTTVIKMDAIVKNTYELEMLLKSQ